MFVEINNIFPSFLSHVNMSTFTVIDKKKTMETLLITHLLTLVRSSNHLSILYLVISIISIDI